MSPRGRDLQLPRRGSSHAASLLCERADYPGRELLLTLPRNMPTDC